MSFDNFLNSDDAANIFNAYALKADQVHLEAQYGGDHTEHLVVQFARAFVREGSAEPYRYIGGRMLQNILSADNGIDLISTFVGIGVQSVFDFHRITASNQSSLILEVANELAEFGDHHSIVVYFCWSLANYLYDKNDGNLAEIIYDMQRWFSEDRLPAELKAFKIESKENSIKAWASAKAQEQFRPNCLDSAKKVELDYRAYLSEDDIRFVDDDEITHD